MRERIIHTTGDLAWIYGLYSNITGHVSVQNNTFTWLDEHGACRRMEYSRFLESRNAWWRTPESFGEACPTDITDAPSDAIWFSCELSNLLPKTIHLGFTPPRSIIPIVSTLSSLGFRYQVSLMCCFTIGDVPHCVYRVHHKSGPTFLMYSRESGFALVPWGGRGGVVWFSKGESVYVVPPGGAPEEFKKSDIVNWDFGVLAPLLHEEQRHEMKIGYYVSPHTRCNFDDGLDDEALAPLPTRIVKKESMSELTDDLNVPVPHPCLEFYEAMAGYGPVPKNRRAHNYVKLEYHELADYIGAPILYSRSGSKYMCARGSLINSDGFRRPKLEGVRGEWRGGPRAEASGDLIVNDMDAYPSGNYEAYQQRIRIWPGLWVGIVALIARHPKFLDKVKSRWSRFTEVQIRGTPSAEGHLGEHMPHTYRGIPEVRLVMNVGAPLACTGGLCTGSLCLEGLCAGGVCTLKMESGRLAIGDYEAMSLEEVVVLSNVRRGMWIFDVRRGFMRHEDQPDTGALPQVPRARGHNKRRTVNVLYLERLTNEYSKVIDKICVIHECPADLASMICNYVVPCPNSFYWLGRHLRDSWYEYAGNFGHPCNIRWSTHPVKEGRTWVGDVSNFRDTSNWTLRSVDGGKGNVVGAEDMWALFGRVVGLAHRKHGLESAAVGSQWAVTRRDPEFRSLAARVIDGEIVALVC